MINKIILIFLLIFLPNIANAQNKDLAVGIGAWYGLRTSTMIVDLYCFKDISCKEINPMFSRLERHPIINSSIQIGLSTTTAYSLWYLRKTHPKIARVLSWSLVGISGAVLVHDYKVTIK